MAAVKSGNTVPELSLRKALHANGLRYRLHVPELAGKPDLVFAKHRAVLFVHGCFWHGHDCGACRIPQTRRDYWIAKIGRNMSRDTQTVRTLIKDGWRVATVWECAVRGPRKLSIESVSALVIKWLHSNGSRLEIRGHVLKGAVKRAAQKGKSQ